MSVGFRVLCQLLRVEGEFFASLGRFSFASVAEEKVIRLFEALRNFLENLTRVSRIDGVLPESAPEGAAVPALGLSNKPVYQVVERQKETKLASGSDLYAENYFTPSHLDGIGSLFFLFILFTDII